MNPFEDPKLRMRVTEQQRDRVLDYLQEAYAAGALESWEFDERIANALQATTRRELNGSYRDLGYVRISRAAVVVPQWDQLSQQDRVFGGLAHLSALFTGFIGPLVMFAVSTDSTPARAEAAKALNFQLLVTVLAFVGLFVPLLFGGELLAMAFWSMYWLVLLTGWFAGTVAASVMAFSGKPGRYPLGFLKAVPTGEPKRRHRELPGR